MILKEDSTENSKNVLATIWRMVVATNNEAVVRFLANYSASVAFHPNASHLCAAGLEKAAARRKAADGGRRAGRPRGPSPRAPSTPTAAQTP